MNRLKQKIIASLAAFVAVVGILAPAPVAHADIISQGCTGSGKSSVCTSTGDSATGMVKIVISMMFFLLGIIAVIMIIIGGFRYVISNGDSGALQSAKNTILYAVIGLIVAILSYAIVNFLLDKVG